MLDPLDNHLVTKIISLIRIFSIPSFQYIVEVLQSLIHKLYKHTFAEPAPKTKGKTSAKGNPPVKSKMIDTI